MGSALVKDGGTGSTVAPPAQFGMEGMMVAAVQEPLAPPKEEEVASPGEQRTTRPPGPPVSAPKVEAPTTQEEPAPPPPVSSTAPAAPASLYERLTAPFDVTWKHDGQNAEYLTGEQVVSRLNEVLGVAGWSLRILEWGVDWEEIEEVWVHCELSFFAEGRMIIRENFGGQKIKRGRGEGKRLVNLTRDKEAAVTTALKKCAQSLGIGLSLSEQMPSNQASPVYRNQEARERVTKRWEAARPTSRQQPGRGSPQQSRPPQGQQPQSSQGGQQPQSRPAGSAAPSAADGPSEDQQKAIRSLAEELGREIVIPKTGAESAKLIVELQRHASEARRAAKYGDA